MEEVFCGAGGGFLLGFAPRSTTGLAGLLGLSSKLIGMPKSSLLFDRKVCSFLALGGLVGNVLKASAMCLALKTASSESSSSASRSSLGLEISSSSSEQSATTQSQAEASYKVSSLFPHFKNLSLILLDYIKNPAKKMIYFPNFGMDPN